MADGSKRTLREVKAGDAVVTVDPATGQATAVTVKELTVHEEKNYAITRLLLVSVREAGREVRLSSRLLQATPNHPMMTLQGEKRMGELEAGDKVLSPDGIFTVWDKEERAGGMQRVYNIVAGGGTTFIMNGVLVLQKSGKFADAKAGVSH
jgi:intein/homing endonuclease